MAVVSANALLTVTATPYRTVTASSVLTATSTNLARPSSINLRYLGSGPDTQTNNIATKLYADNYFKNNTQVDQSWIDNKADLIVGNLLLQDDVSAQINALDGNGKRLYPKISDLNTVLANYPNTSALGAVNGIATADASGTLTNSQIPTGANGIKLDNKAIFYNGLTDSTSVVNFVAAEYTATSSNIAEYIAASFTIKDPGFAYYPMNFVYIQGMASGASTVRFAGTNSVGLVTVAAAPAPNQLPTNIFAQGTCSSTPYRNWNIALPYVNKWTTSPPVKAVTGTTAFRGDLKLNLYLSNYQGTNYTFYRSGLVWNVVLFPTNTTTVAA